MFVTVCGTKSSLNTFFVVVSLFVCYKRYMRFVNICLASHVQEQFSKIRVTGVIVSYCACLTSWSGRQNKFSINLNVEVMTT